MHKLFITLFILVLSASIYSQEVDSLFQVYEDKKNADTTRLNILHLIINKVKQTNFDSAILLTNKEIIEAHSGKYIKQEIKGLLMMGSLMQDKNNNSRALDCYNQALSLAKELKHQLTIGNCYHNIGRTYYATTNYPKALEYELKALQIYESLKNKERLNVSYLTLGNIYSIQKQYDQALNYYFKIAPLNLKNESVNLVDVYTDISVVYAEKMELQSAKLFAFKALESSKVNHDYHKIGYIYNNISAIFERLEMLDSAKVYQLKSIQIRELIHDEVGLAESYANLGYILNRSKLPQQAKINALKALSLTIKTGDRNTKTFTHGVLSEIYFELGDYKEAYIHQKRNKILSDSIFNIENSKQLSDLRTNFEVEKKEIELKEKAKQQQNKLFFGSGAILLFLILMFVFYLSRNKRNKLIHERNSVLLEQKLLRVQMNPHFIFNCLGAIQSFIAVNKPIVANQYLASLAVIMRRVLESSVTEYTSLKTDINLLQNYLELNKMLLDDKLDYSITANNIDSENIQIPSMLIQPFVENAIVHGIKNKGVITITYQLQKTTIVCTIDNNGAGISQIQEKKDASKHKSLALQIVTERLAILQNIPKHKVNISVNDLLDNQNTIIGTRATLEIPFLKI